MRASLLCALCALGAAVPAPIKDTVLTITPPSADLAHDADGPTQGGATGANATDPEAPPETLTAKSEAGAAVRRAVGVVVGAVRGRRRHRQHDVLDRGGQRRAQRAQRAQERRTHRGYA